MKNPTMMSWTDPTTNTDGSPIAAGEITGYLLGLRNVAAPGSAPGTYPITAAVPAGDTTAPLSMFGTLKPGDYAAAAQANGPNDSAWSAEALFTIAPIPAPPTGFSVA